MPPPRLELVGDTVPARDLAEREGAGEESKEGWVGWSRGGPRAAGGRIEPAAACFRRGLEGCRDEPFMALGCVCNCPVVGWCCSVSCSFVPLFLCSSVRRPSVCRRRRRRSR